MAVFETWLKSDLKKPVRVQQLSGNLFSADNGGNLIGVEVMDNGAPATLTGGVTGYIIRPDGATVTVTGTLSGNKASIILPSSAYVAVGQASIVIKNGTTTLGACTAVVYRTTTDTLVDPGHVIPSIEELLAKISDCEAATVAAMKVAEMTVSAETATGSTPTATLTEEGSGALAHKHLTFGLIPGEDGVSPTVTVTTITGGHKVTITDGSGDHEFNVLDGADGQDGQDGADGVSAYCYVRWSSVQPTQDSDMTTTPSDWMGIYSGDSATAPTHYTDYQWYKVKGETGTAQNVYGSTVPMSPTDSTKVETAINGKLEKPSTAGTSGQVLTSDGQGGQSWQTPSGGTVTDVQEDGVSILSNGVANITTMTGASSSASGSKGLVPSPSSGDQSKVLTGDGHWTEKTGANIPMSGTDSTPVKDAIEAIANVVTEIPLTIEPSDWDSSSPYSYEWVDNRVLSDSSVEVEILSAEGTLLYLNYEKSSGGGGIVFTPSSLPTDDVSVLIVITNAEEHSGSSIDADTVSTDAVTGAANVDEALSALNANINTIPRVKTTDITVTTGSTTYDGYYYGNGNAVITGTIIGAYIRGTASNHLAFLGYCADDGSIRVFSPISSLDVYVRIAYV